jgi:hypothetical protein
MFVRSSEGVVIDALEPVIPMPHDLVKSKGRNLRKDSGSLFTNFVNDFRKDYSGRIIRFTLTIEIQSISVPSISEHGGEKL